ncbi:MAG: SDR family NAD(P)-dependent oxidoreductase [Pseudomonadota bacterium]
MSANAQKRSAPPVRDALNGLYFFTRFAYSFSALGYRQRRLCWSDIGNAFEGQRWLVTGASGGIGKAVTQGAVDGGADVLAVARSAEKLARLAGSAEGVETQVCDLSLMEDIRRMVDALVEEDVGPIDVLVNNVGVLLNAWQVTEEGHETSFATNLLGHYVLTEAMLERGLLSDDAVIINMTSGGMYNVPLSVEHLDITDPASHDGVLAYAYQKRAQVELNRWWREQHADGNRQFFVMHPGWADTEGVKTSLPAFRKLFASVLRDAEAGADTALWLAATQPVQRQGDAVWFDRKARAAHVSRATRRTTDDAAGLVAFLRDSL